MQIITQFNSIDSFSTERLIAKKINLKDYDKFTSMHANPKVMATLGGVVSIETITEYFAWHLKHWDQDQFGMWFFYLKDSNEWIGNGGIYRFMIEGKEETEVGYALLPAFWNQGFATEIAQACCEVAFEVIRLNYIICCTLKNNKASQRVMEKAGFEYERNIIHVGQPHVLYSMQNPRQIEIVSYNKKWPDLFKEEAERLQDSLGKPLREIYHIGSTSIPNMPAKPVIDMILVFENLDAIKTIAKKLNKLGYPHLRPNIIPHRAFFARQKGEEIDYHLHIFERGDPQIKRHVNFRDYVTNQSSAAKAYAQLKMKLAEKYKNNIPAYVAGKDDFVQDIDAKAKIWLQQKNDYLSANTGIVAQKWSKKKMIEAIEANLNVYLTHFAQYIKGIELIRIPPYSIINTKLLDDRFNYLIRAAFSKHDANEKIEEVTHYFNNIPFTWLLSPSDQPQDLAEKLECQEYINTEKDKAMFLNLDAWHGKISTLSQLQLIQATDKKTLKDYALISATDHDSSITYFSQIADVLTTNVPIEYFVGYVQNKPVVRGAICYYAQVAGFYAVASCPTHREKKYDKAMYEFLLKRAKGVGYHIAVLLVSAENYFLCQKLGFNECDVFREFKLARNM